MSLEFFLFLMLLYNLYGSEYSIFTCFILEILIICERDSSGIIKIKNFPLHYWKVRYLTKKQVSHELKIIVKITVVFAYYRDEAY